MNGVAIVGMACTYGGASTPAELWDNALSGRRAFRRIPAERLDLADYLGESGTDPDRISVTHAAVLEGYEFDRAAFGVAGPTYRATDLTHWLALDTASRALSDAGLDATAGAADTSVFVGNTLTGEFTRSHVLRTRWPYVRRVVAGLLAERGETDPCLLDDLRDRFLEPFPEPDGDTLAGSLSNTIAGRICSHFGFGGGGYTVDGACASSLLAVIHGCREITEGRARTVVAGGVDLSIDPFELVGFSRAGALARDRMRVFDRGSSGFLPGEGCGMVVLTRLEDAQALGLRPYAVLRGWGVSSDGTGGITRPESEGQRLALDRAYREAGFHARTVSYFEAHGTGTVIGDRAELKALSGLVGEPGDGPLPAVGSVKALIGHTKAAAGAAGLIKAVMAVHTQVVPPTAGCEDPVEELSGDRARLRTVREPETWPQGRPLRAGVSSMGFGGINAHVVVEGLAAHRRTGLDARTTTLGRTPQESELLVFSADSAEELRERIQDAARTADTLSYAQYTDLAAELSRTRGGGAHRAAVTAAPDAGLPGLLRRAADAVAAGRRTLGPDVFTAPPGGDGARIGLLMSGQAASAGRTGGALARRLPAVADLYEGADLPEGDPAADTSVAQPRIVAASLASIAALEALGIRADLAVGHSLGELTALAWAGALSEADLAAVVRERGRAMAALPGDHGAMAALAMPEERVRPLLPDGVGVACLNAPGATVVSGGTAAVDRVVRELDGLRLPVAHAFHSPLVAGAAADLRKALDAAEVTAPRRPVYSTVTGELLAPGSDLREHLVRQTTAPVLFDRAMEAAAGTDLWIEAGPDTVLTHLARGRGVPAFAVEAGSDGIGGLLRCAAAAWALGRDVRVEALYEHRFLRPIDPGRPQRFLANPCERAAPAAAPEPERRPAPVPAPGATAEEAAGAAPADVIRAVVAERAELPLASVTGDTRLRADLHLNSITVAQLIAEAARRLSLPVPAHLTEHSGATIAQIAELLAEGPATGTEAAKADTVAGVAPWVRVFTVDHVEVRPLRPGTGGPRTAPADGGAGGAHVVARDDDALGAALALRNLGEGTLVLRPARDDDPLACLDLVAEAAKALTGARRLLVVQDDDGPAHATAAGFARSAHLELGVPAAVVTVPARSPGAADLVEAEAASLAEHGGYAECRHHPDGTRTEPRLRHRPLSEPPAGHRFPGPGDVLLVTGGGKGIGAECARTLAVRTGARIAVLGRSDPADDPELARNLARFEEDGVDHTYQRADVRDPDSVRRAVHAAVDALGPVTGVLHGAGANEPAALADLDPGALEHAVAPKVSGLLNLLDALDPGPLRLFVSFGSLIARTGLPGEAHYALANEWLGALTEEVASRVEGCRALAVDWSVWSGAGMGERLGTLDALARRGIDPIPLDTGLDLLHRLIASPDVSGGVVVTGRYGDAPTLRAEEAELPMLRFLERPRRIVPGVEAVADTVLRADTDPYLEHHEFEGDRLLPAVLGMEAMAQAASVLTGTREHPVLEDLRLTAPVVVGRGEEVTLRAAALALPDGTVRTVLRSSATGFAVDHFTAVLPPPGTPDTGRRVVLPVVPDAPVPVRPDEHLYGRLLFQDGPLRRVGAYRRLTGYDCVADLEEGPGGAWFAHHLPGRLLLGDPGRRDAALHALQACLPGTRLLPVGAERVTILDTASAPALLHARERHAEGGRHVFDLELTGADGAVLERWEGLALNVMGPGPLPVGVELLGPHLDRRAAEVTGVAGVRVAVERGDTQVRRRARAVHRLLGTGVTVRGRPDGRPELSTGDQVSVTHCGAVTMVATAPVPVGVDLVWMPDTVEARVRWDDVLGPEALALRDALADRDPGRGRDEHAAVVWAASEALRKCAGRPGGPMTLRSLDGPWILLDGGGVTVAVHHDGDDVAAVAVRGGDGA
ncbi:SDR family NAD(P)-dependent oxidoreductase [Nocardiopsis sp. NPDC055824]